MLSISAVTTAKATNRFIKKLLTNNIHVRHLFYSYLNKTRKKILSLMKLSG